MWFGQKLTEQNGTVVHQIGKVTGKTDGGVVVQSDTDYKTLALAAPYGITSIPPQGASAVVLAAGGDGSRDLCIGTRSAAVQIEAGELYLRSAGGASIYLKNNGDVVINGVVY